MRLNSVFLLWLILIGFPASSPSQEQSLEQMLRLKSGNTWIYRGTVEWTTVTTPQQKSNIRSKQLTWKSEILEESVHGSLMAYLVHGSLADLPWYRPGKQLGDYLWIVYQARFYELTLQPNLLARFHDPKDSMVDLIDSDEPMIELPFRLAKYTTALHPAEKRERDDLLYCWNVDSQMRHAIRVKGVPSRSFTQWRLVYRTLPDDEARLIAPGIGFTRYRYSHHGTVSEAHMKLVEAHLK